MRRARFFPAITGVWLIFASAGFSADKPVGQPVSIDALIAQLGDKNFRVRQAAGKATRGTRRGGFARVAQGS